MATGLKNFPNIIPADSDFLSGRIKDNPGDGSGTPINQFTNGDIQEFFARLMIYTGLTPNGVPDSEYTGHQYIQALTKRIFARASKPIIEGIIGTYTPNDLIVLEGVIITITNGGNTATWTKGNIYYNGITYIVDAPQSPITKSGGVFLYIISDTDDFKITISHGISGTGIADYLQSTVKNIGNFFQKTDVSNPLRTRVFNIGTWNMQSDTTHLVSLGLSTLQYLSVRSINVIVYPDDLSNVKTLLSINAHVVNNSGINLSRIDSGEFDSSAYSGTSINRGYITIVFADVS